jgi:hypothetical protein
MEILGVFLWLGLFFLFAFVINRLMKRPLINPWLWSGMSYAVIYLACLFYGFIRDIPNFAYVAGSYLPATVIAFGLGLWQARKWRSDHPLSPVAGTSSAADAE